MIFNGFWVLDQVAEERERQLDKWGEQHHPDGTGWGSYMALAEDYKYINDETVAQGGDPDWSEILLEEVYEALSETDREKLREELIQVAAVAVAWVEDLDSRGQ